MSMMMCACRVLHATMCMSNSACRVLHVAFSMSSSACRYVHVDFCMSGFCMSLCACRFLHVVSACRDVHDVMCMSTSPKAHRHVWPEHAKMVTPSVAQTTMAVGARPFPAFTENMPFPSPNWSALSKPSFETTNLRAQISSGKNGNPYEPLEVFSKSKRRTL